MNKFYRLSLGYTITNNGVPVRAKDRQFRTNQPLSQKNQISPHPFVMRISPTIHGRRSA